MSYQQQTAAAYAGNRRQGEFTRKGTASKLGHAPVMANVACGLLVPIDFAVLAAAAALAYLLRFAGPLAEIGPLSNLDTSAYAPQSAYAVLAAFGCLLAVNVFHHSGLYSTDILRSPGRTIRRLVVGWAGVAAILVAVGFLTKSSEDFSRFWSLMWFGFGLVGLVAIRWAFYARVAQWVATGRLDQKIAILGTGSLAEKVAAHLVANPAAGIRVSGLFDVGDGTAHGCTANQARRRAGELDDLVAQIRARRIDTVLVAMPEASHERLAYIFKRLGEAPVDVRLCLGSEALYLLNRNVTRYAGLTTIDVMDRPLTGWQRTVKEIEDRGLGLLITTATLPLMVAIAIAIRIDSPGPVLFRQKRYGFNNELIEVFKFRTMHVDMTDDRAERLTERNDPRITRVGRFLRRWSLDEVPQFLNVIRGDMSIVGPRPHALAPKAGGRLYEDAVPFYYSRHRVKPGITGWAQVNGWRGETDTAEKIERRVEHDLYYIENWSLLFDLYIILTTPFALLKTENAY
jgi:Undecaprenyl-phosphate glucose phosphotransferase